jgi:hypothetical protein
LADRVQEVGVLQAGRQAGRQAEGHISS